MHDALLVLGGGVCGNSELPEWSERRFDLALKLRTSEPVVCLSAGTMHQPIPLDALGLPVYESVAGATYLRRRGVHARDILVETASWDTVGNAYFSRVLFADPFGWKKLLVITSEFHMARTEALFRWVYGMDREGTKLSFAAASDAGLDMEARREREVDSLASFESGLRQEIRDLPSLHQWLYSQHDCYSAQGRGRIQREDSPLVLATYLNSL